MATQEMPSPDELRKKYPSNSKASKREKPKDEQPQDEPEHKEVRQVAKAKVRKQGFFKRFGKTILEDGIESAKERAYNDIIIPGVKNLLFDSVTDILDSVLFGGSDDRSRGFQRRSNRKRRDDRASYRDYYESPSKEGSRSSKVLSRNYEPDDIILKTRSDALDVLNELDFIVRKYGQASIADLYDIVGITGSWTDNQYGWLSIRGSSIKPIRDGFLLILPRAQLLDE